MSMRLPNWIASGFAVLQYQSSVKLASIAPVNGPCHHAELGSPAIVESPPLNGGCGICVRSGPVGAVWLNVAEPDGPWKKYRIGGGGGAGGAKSQPAPPLSAVVDMPLQAVDLTPNS